MTLSSTTLLLLLLLLLLLTWWSGRWYAQATLTELVRNVNKTVLEDLVEEATLRDYRKSKLAKYKLARLLPLPMVQALGAAFDLDAAATTACVRGVPWEWEDGRSVTLPRLDGPGGAPSGPVVRSWDTSDPTSSRHKICFAGISVEGASGRCVLSHQAQHPKPNP